MTPKEQVMHFAEQGEEILTCDGFDAALLGVQQTFEEGGVRYRALYSVKTCIEVMVAQGSTPEEALEYLDFNTLGAYVGPSTPSFLLDYGLGEAG